MQKITNITKIAAFILASCLFMILWDECSGTYSALAASASLTTESQLMAQETIASNQHKDKNYSRSMWASLSHQLKMDHKTYTPEVKKQIRLLLSNRKHFNKILQAATPYIYYIYKQTKDRGFPAEIALIPFIESEFSPNDHSSVGASGLWQLMPGTARELGVKIRRGYDGRRNVVQSTKAALTYFNDLKRNYHGNWYLAIAAYNSGPGRVNSASRRAGGSKNFFQLKTLPRETRIYVPKLLAVAEIIKHPKKYGITIPDVNEKPFFSELPIHGKKSVNLNHLIKAKGVNRAIFKKLNPDLKNSYISPILTHSILIPADTANNTAIKQI